MGLELVFVFVLFLSTRENLASANSRDFLGETSSWHRRKSVGMPAMRPAHWGKSNQVMERVYARRGSEETSLWLCKRPQTRAYAKATPTMVERKWGNVGEMGTSAFLLYGSDANKMGGWSPSAAPHPGPPCPVRGSVSTDRCQRYPRIGTSRPPLHPCPHSDSQLWTCTLHHAECRLL